MNTGAESRGTADMIARKNSFRNCATLGAETVADEPFTEEKMARRRFQDPKPRQKGNWWWLLMWQDEYANEKRTRRRKRIKLAPASTPEREVRKIAAEILRPLNQGLEVIGSATKFDDFIESIYVPTILPLMATSTQQRYQGVIRNYLKPAFSNLCLRDLTTLSVQHYLSSLAGSTLSYESRDKIKDTLSSILGSAVQFGLLVKNPVEGRKLPRCNKGTRTKPYVTPAQFAVLVEMIPEPYASMVFVAVYTGMRISEIVGLRWRNVHDTSIAIEERYCRGDCGPPKSESSRATIAVSSAVIKRLERLRTLTVKVKAGRATRQYRVVKSDGPDDLVFQSLLRGRPMRDNNILTRHIKPAARKLGLVFVNWRCLRTSHATWLKMAGADVKDAQAQMRHSRASTTLDIYQQFVPESQRAVVDKLAELACSKMVN